MGFDAMPPHSNGIATPSRLCMRGGCVVSTSKRGWGQLGNRPGRPGEGGTGIEGGRYVPHRLGGRGKKLGAHFFTIKRQKNALGC